MKAFRVLIIDDGQAGDDLSHHLKLMYGAEAFIAKRLDDGLKMRHELAHLDYVVLDLSLPDSPSREDTMKCISALRGANQIPVFVFTGYEEADLLQKCIDHGAEAWFLKGDNHRGASSLAARMGTSFIREHLSAIDAPQKKKISDAIMVTRKAQAEPERKTDPWKVIGGIAAVVVICSTLVGASAWVVHSIQASAEERANQSRTLSEVSVQMGKLTARLEITEAQAAHLTQDNVNIHTDLGRIEGQQKEYQTEMRGAVSHLNDNIVRVMIALKVPPEEARK